MSGVVIAGCMLAAAVPASAQGALRSTLTGRVLDAAGQPVRGVRVASTVDSVLSVSDERGRFTLRGLTPGMTRFNVRRIGYAPAEFSVGLVAAETLLVDLKLEQDPVSLPGMETVAESHAKRILGTFYRHRDAFAGGHFIMRDEIERRHPLLLSDVVRTVPGVMLVPGPDGLEVRMARATGAIDCPIQYWVDGIRATALELDDVPPQDVEALEIYNGGSTLPPEYNGRYTHAACGTIAIWTRVPGK